MTMTMDEIVQRFEEVERRLDALEHLASAARDDAKPHWRRPHCPSRRAIRVLPGLKRGR